MAQTCLQELNEISMNYWWSWNQKTWSIFSTLNPQVWNETRNPILVLKTTKKLEEKLTPEIQKQIHAEFKKFKAYMNRGHEKTTWYAKNHSDLKGPIAYFSAEFGIHEALPIYSGGLGILAGDHVKSASDLGLPMVFIGLFYSNGYFIQRIDQDGRQIDLYGQFDPDNLSMTPVLNPDGSRLVIHLEIADKTISVWAHKAQVGTSELYLLDSNHPDNTTEDRLLTAKLYGGDREMRISQEIILGIGGIKLLKVLNIQPEVFHMNEGHSGFFQLERIRNAMADFGMTFNEAKHLCSTNCVFTTHTPVPAGNEAFSLPVMHKYFYKFIREFNISWRRFIELGLVPEKSDYKFFSLTVFAINVSKFYNGVSELHGKIAKKMWRDAWPQVPLIENPMTHITNGVHVQTWMSLEVKNLLEKQLGESWVDELSNHQYWKTALDFSTDQIRQTKIELKAKMIQLVRQQLKAQLFANNESAEQIAEVDHYLNEQTLVIGFARRFATYKRATLIFKDLKKLEALVNNPQRPVAFVFAGKAHPQDLLGQKYIEDIYKYSRMPQFKDKIIILENYDMNIAKHLVSGCDVWLNNPRRPMEASGTSGQKVPLNFGLNFSVLDGWWREAYDGQNGWSIGDEKDFPNDDVQDFEDAQDFYKTLEHTLLPLYYANSENNKNGVNHLQASQQWVEKTKVSFTTNISRYSTQRMVQDYMEQMYAKAFAYGHQFFKNKDLVKTYLAHRQFLKMNWKSMYFTYIHFDQPFIEIDSKYEQTYNTPLHHVEFQLQDNLPGRIFETNTNTVHLGVYLGDIKPHALVVEAVISDGKTELITYEKLRLKEPPKDGVGHYELKFKSSDLNSKRLRFRVYGHDQFLSHPHEYGFMMWY